MLLVHKIELNPNNEQATCFAKACGVARFSYNWALARWQSEYEAGRRTSEVTGFKCHQSGPVSVDVRRDQSCATIHDMPLSKRVLACEYGNVINRDLNASINLEHVAVSSTETKNACGAEGSGDVATPYFETMP